MPLGGLRTFYRDVRIPTVIIDKLPSNILYCLQNCWCHYRPSHTIYTPVEAYGHSTESAVILYTRSIGILQCLQNSSFYYETQVIPTWSHTIHSSVSILRRLTALLSLLRHISRTMERRFQMPSGSRPLRGLSRLVHSADAWGALDEMYKDVTSLEDGERWEIHVVKMKTRDQGHGQILKTNGWTGITWIQHRALFETASRLECHFKLKLKVSSCLS